MVLLKIREIRQLIERKKKRFNECQKGNKKKWKKLINKYMRSNNSESIDEWLMNNEMINGWTKWMSSKYS